MSNYDKKLEGKERDEYIAKRFPTCVICNQDIKPNAIGWKHGNNAQPVAEGQCCDECYTNKVLPARLQGRYPKMSMSRALELSAQLVRFKKGIE